MIRALRSSRDFRLLVAGEAVSRAGTAASFVAVWSVAVYELHVSAPMLSVLMLCSGVPRVVSGWFAGRMVDRYDPRRVLIAANIWGCVGSLLQWGSHGTLQLALATIVAGASFGAFMPAISSMSPRVVDDEHLLGANSIMELTWQGGFIIGPAIGAALIGIGGVRAPLLFDAVSFLVGSLWIVPLRLRPKPPRSDEEHAADHDVRGLVRGLRYVWSLPVARYVTVMSIGAWLGVSVFIVLEPIYVARVLHAGPATLGLLQTGFGTGAILGSAIAARSESRAGPLFLAVTTAVCGGSMVMYGGTKWLAVAALGVALWGVGLGATTPVARTLLQRGVPIARHGLANGVQTTLQSVGEILPIAAAGQLASVIGVRPALVGAGAWTVALAVWGVSVGRRLEVPRAAPPIDEDYRAEAATGARNVGTSRKT